ncbi:unnamed protein product [Durusdinium trenchii]|uniref:Uncharacterized protein n=1 Tax=Durusdinium trenchii TaxID=1381693 RepID=A0ABP0PQD7_9DINO
MNPSWALVLIAAWSPAACLPRDHGFSISAHQPSDQVKKVKENFLDKSTYGFYGSPTGNWEADLVADEQPDDQSLDAKTDRALSRVHLKPEEEAERSLQAKKVAEKKYQEIQEKELKFREKMVKALSLAKKYRGEIASLETKKRFQDEAIKWVQEDVKYGETEVIKYQQDSRHGWGQVIA